jgi:hypothetical protein
MRSGYLEVHEVPIIIPSLMSLCRKSVNLNNCREQILGANLPVELKRFLTYESIREGSGQSPHGNNTSSSSSSFLKNDSNKFQGPQPPPTSSNSSFASSMSKNLAF